MKDKIVFFVIGAVLSALAFFAGSQQNKKPDAPPSELNVKTIQCKELRVEDFIWVGKEGGAWIGIGAGSKGDEELGIPADPNTSGIQMYSGLTTDILGRDIQSHIHLSVSEGVAGIGVDSNFPRRNPRAGSISINAWNAGAAQVKVESGDKEEEVTVTAD